MIVIFSTLLRMCLIFFAVDLFEETAYELKKYIVIGYKLNVLKVFSRNKSQGDRVLTLLSIYRNEPKLFNEIKLE